MDDGEELKESVDENPTREESGEQAKQLGKIHELNGRRELSEMDKKNRAEISRKEKFSAQNCYWQNEKWTLRAKRRKSRVNSSVDFDGKRVLQKKKKSNGIFEELSASTWKDDNCRTLSKPINEFARAETIRFPDNARQNERI